MSHAPPSQAPDPPAPAGAQPELAALAIPGWLFPILGGGALLVALLGAMVAAQLRGGLADADVPPVSIAPAGEEVPRRGPIVVSFRDVPRAGNHAQLIAFSPAAEVTYLWADERTLLVQPAYPGLRRGGTYELRVSGEAAGLEQDFLASFTVEGRLTVEAVIPGPGDGSVPSEAQIYVQFSRSVAPLTVLQSPAAAPVIEFDPPLEGEGEWLNTSLYRFTPATLRPSTVYRARVVAGLTTEDDGVLEQDYAWSFETVGPALARSEPADGSLYVPRASEVVLEFNQPMDRASVEAGVRLAARGGAPIAVSAAWSEDGRTVTLSPAEALSLSTTLEVQLPRGLRGAVGGESESQRTITFSTSEPPRLVRSNPGDGHTSASRWGVELQFNNPMDVGSIEDRLTISGIPSERIQVYTWDEMSLSVQAQFEPSTTYTLAIAAGATDREGLSIDPISITFTTGRLETRVWYATAGWSGIGTYAAGTDQLLYFYATNLTSVDFELRRIPHETVSSFLGGKGSDLRSQGERVRRWTVQTPGATNTQVQASTSLGDGQPLPPGYYFVHSPVGPNHGWPSLLFVVTDTALVTKLAQDELLVWALDHATGAPLAHVELRANGPHLVDAVARTDADGLATFTVPQRRDLSSNTERAYVVSIDDGRHFGTTRTNWQEGASPWQLGLPVEWMPRHYVGHLYTDRPIYRPGETIHFKAVIRRDDDARYHVPEAGDTGLRLTITDARGTNLESARVVTTEFGTFVGEFVVPEGGETGHYQIAIMDFSGPHQARVAGATFLVAEFRRPEFQVAVDAGALHHVNGETIEATVEATFFFGGPLADARASWSALAYPAAVWFPGYERYSFSDFDAYRRDVLHDPLRASGEAATGADGVARVPMAASLRAGESTQDYTVSVTVLDESGQAIAGSATTRVHPAEYYVGVGAGSYVAREGEATTIDLATVDVQGAVAPSRRVSVSVYRREWITVKEQTEAGGRRYRSEPNDTLLEVISVTTDADGRASLPYTPAAAGALRIVATTTDAAGRTASAAQYIWVSGPGVVPWEIRNDDIIELVADREQYAIGDVAEVLVPAPFPGAIALVTVERNRVLERSVRTFDSNSDVLLIPIEHGHVPNVFVSVVLYRSPTAEDPVPRYHVGYAKLNVSTESRHLDVAITSDVERARPRDTVTYDVEVRDSEGRGVQAELSLAVVDMAVLSLAAEIGPDGMGAFWFERGLGVETGSSMALSIDRSNDRVSEPQEGGKGGGGEEADSRGDFRNTAHWEGRVVTDANGRASVRVALPDNLTTWRAQVRAVSGETLVGESVHELLVTQPVLLRPALPRFLRVGDEPQIRTLVRNGSDRAESVTVAVEASGIALTGAEPQTRSIAPGASAVFAWPASVAQGGEARITFRASGGGHSDAVTITLPAHRDVTAETVATGGSVGGTSAIETVYLPPFAITDDGALELALLGSLVGALTDELRHLRPDTVGRPTDESVVRIASRLSATINARRAEGGSGEALLAGLGGDLATLRALQRYDGGWGWCRTCSTNVTVTGWVLVALGEAREAGAEDAAGMAARASLLLREAVNRRADVARPVDPNERAFMLYALQHGTGESWVQNNLRSLVEQDRARLSAWGRSYAILGLLGSGAPADDPLVRALMSDLNAEMLPSATGNHWEAPPLYGSIETNTSTTALVLRALVAADPRHPLIEGTARWLVHARTAERWQSAVERAQAVAGLGRYAELTGERAGNYDYRVTLDEAPLLVGRFRPSEGLNHDGALVPLADLTVGQLHRIALSRQAGSGRLYYAMNLRYITPAREVEALNRGLAVSHRYSLLGAPERSVSEARLGDVVRVTVTVVAPADRKFVLVEDFLPAGLEAIDTRLDIVAPELRRELEEERHRAVSGDQAVGYAAPWYRWYWSPWEETNVRDDRFTLFATDLPRGVHEYVYYARATAPGEFFVAPARAEEQAMPDVFGRSDSGWFVVRE